MSSPATYNGGEAGGLERLTISSGTPTRFGQIDLAGEVRDAEPIMARRLRVLDGLVISVVTAGEGRYRWPDGATTAISGPMLTVVLPGEPHWYGTDPGRHWTEWFAVASGPLFELVVSTAHLQRSGPRRFPAGVRPGDLALFVEQHPHHPAAAEDQVWALAHWLADALREPDDDSARLERSRQLLTDDFATPVVLTDVAAEIGLGYETFRRRFRDRFGQAPLAYRNDRRLEAAATLLRLTTLTCHEIADRLGYTDEFHLSRRFRSRFAVSPTAYRRADRQGATPPRTPPGR